MKKGILLTGICFILLYACVEPINFTPADGAEHLIVEGLITDEPGPYTVKLSKTRSFSQRANAPVGDAEVTLSDDLGRAEILKETKPGIYATAAGGMRGETGRTYTLTVKTGGNTYVSEPERLMAVPEVEALTYNFDGNPYINKEDLEYGNYTFSIYADFQDPPADKNYYRWAVQGVYEYKTVLTYKRFDSLLGHLVWYPDECCETYWFSDPNPVTALFSDFNNNGSLVKKKHIVELPVTKKKFGIKYQVKVAQYSLSEAGYRFWGALQQRQQTAANSFFDKIPPANTGNMYNADNPDEEVMGYFGASAVKRKHVFIDFSEIPSQVRYSYFFEDYHIIYGDCRLLPFATAIKPHDWK